MAKMIFDLIYADVNGYALSQSARSKATHYDQAHTYGEISFEAFSRVLENVHPKTGEVFYDLGSGTGKAVMLAHLLHHFKRTVGLEYFEELNDAAKSVKERYRREFGTTLGPEKYAQAIDFITTDFLLHDFSDADVVFVHSTCMYDDLIMKLEKKFNQLKKGARVLTVSKPMLSEAFEQYKVQTYNMAWGQATVFFYKKI